MLTARLSDDAGVFIVLCEHGGSQCLGQYRASVFPFQNCVNSVSGFANSVFYRFRFDKFRFYHFRYLKFCFNFLNCIFGVNDFC